MRSILEERVCAFVVGAVVVTVVVNGVFRLHCFGPMTALAATYHWGIYQYVAAKALTTYLILGCVGRGVELGSESSPAAPAAGSGNLEI